MIYILTAAAALVLAAILYLRELFTKLDKYGIKYIKPVSLLGNMAPVVMKKRHMALIFQQLHEMHPGERFTAMYEFMKPTIHINDPELVKKIAIKDFEHFVDRKAILDVHADPLLARNLFNMQGQDWKDMRSTLSPAFTSSKMRSMVPFMKKVNEQMIKALNKKILHSENGHVDIDCKDLTTRYANDVIASCAFGVEVDSHIDDKNDFYTMGTSLSDLGVRTMLVVLGYMAVPALMKKLQIKVLPEKTTSFFTNIVKNNMKEREQHKILRPDMIHLLMEAKKGKLRHEDKETADAGFATVQESEIGTKTVQRDWSENDLVAQAVLFYIAGLETVSTTIAFLLYELARNPGVQERLAQEITEHDARNGGKFDYSSIQDLKYLDMVVSEVLRMWPQVLGLLRECVKDYNIGRANDQTTRDYIVRKGDQICIPLWSFHRNKENFPDPDKFDPERFSEENKRNIKPFTYIPFGIGPRNCIGSRFALCEVKVMAYQIIQQFEVSRCEKTAMDPVLDPSHFRMAILGGTWVRTRLRRQS